MSIEYIIPSYSLQSSRTNELQIYLRGSVWYSVSLHYSLTSDASYLISIWLSLQRSCPQYWEIWQVGDAVEVCKP